MLAFSIFIGMKICSYFFCLLTFFTQAQTLQQCKYRFDTYLNFRGTLNGSVKFENDALCLMSGGKKELIVYADELPLFSEFFKHSSLKQQEQLIQSKGNKRFTKQQSDSLSFLVKTFQKKIAARKINR